MTKQKPKPPSEQEVIALAARAQVALRTARRAIVEGVDAIRGEVVRARLRAAMEKP
jgi:hypothetical protein